ncbi:MAG: hypothetical protein ACHQVS_05160 [Candidatus Babeliales bacterium]
MIYMYLIMLTTLAITNVAYSMEEIKEAASKETPLTAAGILPSLSQAQEPKLHKTLPIMVKNNTGHDASLTLSYHLEDKKRIRMVQTFLDKNESTTIGDYKGVYTLTGIKAHLMYGGRTAFAPLHLNIQQRALLTHNDAYISLEEVNSKLVIHVRLYQKKEAQLHVVKHAEIKAQETKRAAVPVAGKQ